MISVFDDVDIDGERAMAAQQIELSNAGRQQKVDDQAIEALAKETHVEVDRIRELYQTAHAQLAAQARIKTYLSVIATRLVRSALQSSSHSSVQ